MSDHRDLRIDTTPRPVRPVARGLAEIEVLLRCLAAGLRVRTEVEMGDGRPVDLLVSSRTSSRSTSAPARGLDSAPPVPEAFTTLADVPRPYLVGVRWLGAEPPDATTIAEVRRLLRGRADA